MRTVITLWKKPVGVVAQFANDDNVHIAVQLQHNEWVQQMGVLYLLYKLYCSGRLEEVHKGNGCSYSGTVC